MRTVLVCVPSPRAAREVASAAARSGLAAAVRTATSEPEVMLRLAERPPDIVLADTSLARSDSVGFTRRVLARAPRTALVLLGPDGDGVVAATIAAGARGLLRTRDQDAVVLVATALLLINAPGRPGGRPDLGVAEPDPPRGGGPQPSAPPVVPTQRDIALPPEDGGAGDGDRPAGPPMTPPTAVESGPRPSVPADPCVALTRGAAPGGRESPPAEVAPLTAPVVRTPRRIMLTERESQVLRAMADGKSNAEIGRELYVSEDTVKTHARRLFRKLDARDRAHAVATGFRAGLVA